MTSGAGSERPWGPRDWDRLSKVGVSRGIVPLLGLFGVVVDPADLTPAPVDLPGTTHRADLVYTLSGDRVAHVEIQQRPDPQMALRMLEYAVRLWGRYPRSIRSGGLIQILVQVTGDR